MPSQEAEGHLQESTIHDHIDAMDMAPEVDLEDSDFEPGSDRELLGLFFPEVKYVFKIVYLKQPLD